MKNLLELCTWPGSRGLLGVDIGVAGVRVIELARRRGVLACRHYGKATLPPGASLESNPFDVQALATAVNEARLASGSRACRAALAMPADSLITQMLRLPAGLPEEQLEILVELEAAQYMPFALDDASLDFCVLGPAAPLAGMRDSSEIEVLLVAARRVSVAQRVELAAAAGLQAVAIDSEALAVQAAMQQGGWRAMADGAAAQLAWGLAMHGFAP